MAAPFISGLAALLKQQTLNVRQQNCALLFFQVRKIFLKIRRKKGALQSKSARSWVSLKLLKSLRSKLHLSKPLISFGVLGLEGKKRILKTIKA